MTGNNKKKKNGWKRGLLITLCVLLTLVLAVAVLGTVYWQYMLNQMNRPVDLPKVTLSPSEIQQIENGGDEVPTGTGQTVPDEEIDFGTQPQETIGGEEIINIMLIGQDRRSGQGRQRSDAMILCSLNKTTKVLTMTSFLRDTYVQIPGHKNNRINASYQFGGMELLDECIELNFGVHVDANVEVDFNGFISLIDMMGGVTIDLTSSEAKYLNNRGNWGAGNVTESGEEWNLKAGKNKLTGTQALAYSRIRAIGMDFERTERQRKVITAVLNQVKSLSLLELNGLLTHGLSLITTDMTNAEITGYVLEVFPMLMDLEIRSQRVPADGTYDFKIVRGMDVVVIDFDANRKMLQETILG